ncbi:hypothetical protein BH23ACT5_BH23ACT5_06860 [soil metagenome]
MPIDTSPIDEDALDAVAASLDLREPNRRALRTIALRLVEHEQNGQTDTFEGIVDAAVGMGKTYILAGAIEYFATVDGTRNFAVIVPGQTILEKTKNNFTPGHPKSLLGGMSVRPVVITSENFQSAAVRADMEDDMAVKLFIFTVQSLIKPTTKAGRKTHDFEETLGKAFYEHLEGLGDLIVLADEHHVYFGTNAKAFSAAVTGLGPRALIGLTGTPHPKTEDKVIFRYPLAAGIANEYVKTPVVVGRRDDRKDDLTKLSDGAVLLEAKQALLDRYCDATGHERINAVMLVVAGSIEEAQTFAAILTAPDFRDGRYADAVLEVHSKSADEDLAALAAVEEPDSPVRIIVSVDKLKEGWDVANVYVIASMRASISKILTEQTLGRGLRLPFGTYTGEEFLDTLEVVAHERYDDLLRSKKVFTEAFVDYETESITVVDSTGTVKVRNQQTTFDIEPGDLSAAGAAATGTATIGDVESRSAHAEKLAVKVEMPYNTADFPVIEVPIVKIHKMDSVFSLGHITDFDPFRNLARRITEQPDEELRRMLYGARVVTGPDGLRQTQVVLREAADDIAAAQLDLPEEQIRARLLDVIMGSEIVAPRKNERAHAHRILDAFFDSLDDSALPTLAAHLDRWAAALLGELRKAYQTSKPTPTIEHVVETLPLAKNRIARSEVAESRFGPFNRKAGYEGWERSPYAQAWFDSTPERDTANAIDASEEVELWIRLHRNDLPILWSEFNEYNPDFLVFEVDGPAYVVEIKGDSSAETESVKAKAEVARRWANEVSADEKVDREWKYLFVTESQVNQAKGSWDAMKALGT